MRVVKIFFKLFWVNNYIIALEYDHANEFTDGKARVWLGDEWLYIDKDGNRVDYEEDDDLPF